MFMAVLLCCVFGQCFSAALASAAAMRVYRGIVGDALGRGFSRSEGHVLVFGGAAS